MTSTWPSVVPKFVPSPFFIGAYVCPPSTTPPPESASLKPLLNVASSRGRSLWGTSISPRGSVTEGSRRPGLYVSVVRFVLIHARPATTRGDSVWLRRVVSSTGGSASKPARVACQTPSPGRAGGMIAWTRAGRYSLAARAPAAAPEPTLGSAFSVAPPLGGAVRL